MNGVDVVYVHPAKQPVGFRYDRAGADYIPYLLMPVGVIGLANVLRQNGYSVKGLNYAIEAFLDPLFDLRTWLRKWATARLVMIDLHWYEHSYGALEVAKVCKQTLPEAHVVMGGFTASAYAKEILTHFPQVDFVIRGDAEKPLLRLTQRVCGQPPGCLELSDVPNLSYRVGDTVVENSRSYCANSEELDNLNFVDIDFLEHHQQYAEMQYTGVGLGLDKSDISQLLSTSGHWLCIGRGCHFDCSFCGGGKASHKRIEGREALTLRSVNRVVDDVQRLAEMGRHQVSLALDPAILGKEYWSVLFVELRRRGVKIGIYNEHFQLPPEEFVAEFAQSVDVAHSVLAFSPLSGSAKVRKINGKFFSNEKFLRTLNIVKRYGIPVFVYFSLNLPAEDEESFKQTRTLADKVYRLYPSHLLRIYNMCHTVDPYSPMSIEPRKYGIKVSMRTFMDYYDYCRQTYVARPELKRGELRGFTSNKLGNEAVEVMARVWDRACVGREGVRFPILSV